MFIYYTKNKQTKIKKGKLFGKKLLQCYEEYLNNYPSIIKYLKQIKLFNLIFYFSVNNFQKDY